MVTLILVLISAIAVAFFATQNTQTVFIAFGNYRFSDVPLYFVVLAALLLGILVSWLISLVSSVSSFFAIHGVNKEIQSSEKQVTTLTKKVHELELENARLKTQLHLEGDEKSL